MRRAALFAALALGLTVILAPPIPRGRAAAPAPPTATAVPTPPLLLLGPGGTQTPLLGLIGAARTRVLVEAFALVDPTVIAALQAAERRGVDVRVMLEPRGLNVTTTLAQLKSAGIRTRVPNSAYGVTHMDEVVIDATTLAVLTTPLTALTLGPAGGSYMVVDHDRRDVLQGASIFYDDWLRRRVNLFSNNLVVLPDDAARVASLIDGAGVRVEIYTSYLSDGGVVASLRAARARGVTVRILTPRSSNNPTLPALAQRSQVRFRDAGAGTLLIVDRRTVLVGTMDLASQTLANSRELGVVLSGQTIVSLADSAFFTQFAHGAALQPATPRGFQRGRTVVVGALKVVVTVSPVVRLGGQAVLVVSTAAGARISVTVAYPPGSKPAATATGISGRADSHGAFVYRWFVAGKIKTGLASARLLIRGRGSAIIYTAHIAIVR